jgi:hypothetical protein
MIDYLVNFAERLGHWGYFVIFLVGMLECQAIVGWFMPGETLVLVGRLSCRPRRLRPRGSHSEPSRLPQLSAIALAMNSAAILEGIGCYGMDAG